MHPYIQEQIKQIAGDRVSGASEITQRAAEMLASLPVYSDASSAGEFRQELVEVGRALAAAQPAMASLLNLVNQVLLDTDRVKDFDRLLVTVEHTAEDYAAALARRPEQIARTALSLIPDDATVMTISSSSAVLTTLKRAHEAGVLRQTICLESRPQREGITLALQLADAGLQTVLAVDAAMASLMAQVQVVFLGADAISMQGLVNKIGSYSLAIVADAHGVPVYGLAGTDKFLPSSLLSRFEIEEKDPREILDEPAPPGLRVSNVYFDITPLDWLAGVVTQLDILTSDRIVHELEQIKVHPALLTD